GGGEILGRGADDRADLRRTAAHAFGELLGLPGRIAEPAAAGTWTQPVDRQQQPTRAQQPAPGCKEARTPFRVKLPDEGVGTDQVVAGFAGVLENIAALGGDRDGLALRVPAVEHQ